MFQAINTKILIAILAALTVIGGVLLHIHQVSERNAAAAEKTALILKQQQDAAAAEKARQAAFWADVEKKKKASNSLYQSKPGKKGAYQSYIP